MTSFAGQAPLQATTRKLVATYTAAMDLMPVSGGR